MKRLWRASGGVGGQRGGMLHSHISTVTPGFVSAAEPSGLGCRGAAPERLKVKCKGVVALVALVEGFKLPIFLFFFTASLPLRF